MGCFVAWTGLKASPARSLKHPLAWPWGTKMIFVSPGLGRAGATEPSGEGFPHLRACHLLFALSSPRAREPPPQPLSSDPRSP